MARIATPKLIDQIDVKRVIGKAQMINSIDGITIEAQIRCIETNALVGGSHPQAPQN